MVQSGLGDIDEPEGGALFQSVHKILRLEMSVKRIFLLFSFFWMCTHGPGFIVVCNCVFVFRADMKVRGLFCMGPVFGTVKGLTVISDVAKGDPGECYYSLHINNGT